MTGEAGEPAEELVRCVCGRLLADPVSRARGLGPRCYRRLRRRTRRRTRLSYVPAHPRAIPIQLALSLDIPPADEDDPQLLGLRLVADVPTGGLL